MYSKRLKPNLLHPKPPLILNPAWKSMDNCNQCIHVVLAIPIFGDLKGLGFRLITLLCELKYTWTKQG